MILATSALGVNGFCNRETLSVNIPQRFILSSECPDMKRTGRSGRSMRMSRATSGPLAPGMITSLSSRSTSGWHLASLVASAVDLASRTSYPWRFKIRTVTSRTA